MPKTLADAPENLPEAAARIFVAAFNAAYDGTCNQDDACASKIAWAAVKKSYEKSADDKWVAKSEGQGDTSASPVTIEPPTVSEGENHERAPLTTLSMYITKVSRSDSGVRRWSSTASDDAKDNYGTSMSMALFNSFIKYAKEGRPIPEQFRSSHWSGGLPYLGVAHYPDLDGFGVLGPTEELFIDGHQLKARGTFENPLNPKLVEKAFEAIRSDIKENVPHDKRVRISIGFLDWQHRHGDWTFTRKSLAHVCPVCSVGNMPDEYLDGQLIHLATTRVPVNTRTEIQAWQEQSMTTRKEDAESIVGEELAAELDSLSAPARTDAVKFLAENGATGTSDAMAEESLTVKSEPDAPRYYGGALTISDAMTWITAQQEEQRLSDLWWIFKDVMCNILWADPELVPDRAAAMKGAIDDFKKQIGEDAAVALSQIRSMIETIQQGVVNMADTNDTTTTEQPLSHPLDASFAQFRAAYDSALAAGGTRQDVLQKLQMPMNELGKAVLRSVDQAQPLASGDIRAIVQEVVEQTIAPLLAAVKKDTPAGDAARSMALRQAPPAAPPVIHAPAGKGLKVADIVKATVFPNSGGA